MENSRDEQRKAIKYNQLVENCLIFPQSLLAHQARPGPSENAAKSVPRGCHSPAISPYLTESNINRSANYTLNLAKSRPTGTTVHPETDLLQSR